MSQTNLPNFLYLGPDKAGSSWLFGVLGAHPQIHVSPAKDLYFFAPQAGRGGECYHRGLEWYARQFRGAGQAKVRCELSHDYLFSPLAAERIARDLPEVRLMVCLREPVSRAFSAYLHLRMTRGDVGSFEQAIHDHPTLLTHGLYHQHLQAYLDRFSRDRIFLGVFDDLKADPDALAQSVFAFLNLDPSQRPELTHERVLPAGKARSKWTAPIAGRSADLLRGLGLANVLGRIKTSPPVRSLFFQPYAEHDRPALDADHAEQLKTYFQADVHALDRTLGKNLAQRWGYLKAPSTPCPHQALGTRT